MPSIHSIPSFDRPREKLLRAGPSLLSDTELLAVLIGSGNKGSDVMKLSKAVLGVIDWPAPISLRRLQGIKGIGSARACLISAALELGRRRQVPRGACIHTPEDVLPLVAYLANRTQEHLICISLNGAAEVLGSRVVAIGTLTGVPVHPREVFASAITERAAAVILVHNHPSGSCSPSAKDRAITLRLKKAGKILGIDVYDHIIISKGAFFSFRKHRLL